MFSILRPARTQAVPDNVRVVADLDKLVAEPIGFRLNGKVHVIKPITTRTFLLVSQKLGELDILRAKISKTGEISEREIVERYHAVFQSCSDTMTKDDIRDMTHSQRAALLQVILECIGGKAHVQSAEESEKKNALNPA